MNDGHVILGTGHGLGEYSGDGLEVTNWIG